MTDLNTMTKSAINALLAAPLSASALKKTSHADLVAKFDAMPATTALDADIADSRADDTPPTEPTLGQVIANLNMLDEAARCLCRSRMPLVMPKRILARPWW